jgi:hypothetical protein
VIEQLEQIASVTVVLSFPVNSPRCWSWKTGDHEEQNSRRLTVDGRALTIRGPIHKLLAAFKYAPLTFLQKE